MKTVTEKELEDSLPRLWRDNTESDVFLITGENGKPHHIITVEPYLNKRTINVLFGPWQGKLE